MAVMATVAPDVLMEDFGGALTAISKANGESIRAGFYRTHRTEPVGHFP